MNTSLPGDGTARAGVEDYYASNAPVPGSVGVASARITRPPPDTAAPSSSSYPSSYLASSSSSNENCDPLEPGKMGLTDSRVYNPDATPSSHYIAPPPQPARSYTPTSKAVMRMGAPQPLYSNTNKAAPTQQHLQHHQRQMFHHQPPPQQQMSQPLYSNQHQQQQQQQQQAVYSNVPRTGSANGAPMMQQQQQQQQFYANVAPRNGKHTDTKYLANTNNGWYFGQCRCFFQFREIIY